MGTVLSESFCVFPVSSKPSAFNLSIVQCLKEGLSLAGYFLPGGWLASPVGDLGVLYCLTKLLYWKWNEVAQSCPTLRDPMDCSLPGSSIHGIFQAKVLEWAAIAAAKSPESCPTLCDPIDGSPPGCPVPGILQARTLEWVAISFSNAWKWKVKVKLLSCVQLLAAPWTIAYQAPLSMGFSRQEYWSGVPLPSLGCHKAWTNIE